MVGESACKAAGVYASGDTRMTVMIESSQFRRRNAKLISFQQKNAQKCMTRTEIVVVGDDHRILSATDKGATTGGRGRGPDPPIIWTDHPNFLIKCDYRYVTDCSARN